MFGLVSDFVGSRLGSGAGSVLPIFCLLEGRVPVGVKNVIRLRNVDFIPLSTASCTLIDVFFLSSCISKWKCHGLFLYLMMA